MPRVVFYLDCRFSRTTEVTRLDQASPQETAKFGLPLPGFPSPGILRRYDQKNEIRCIIASYLKKRSGIYYYTGMIGK